MSKKVQVTKPFPFKGARFYAGDICTGDAAEFALEQGYGKTAPVEKSASPKNKSASPESKKEK